MTVCVCEMWSADACVVGGMWGSDDSFMESVLPSTCNRAPGIELRLSSLHRKHHYPLSHSTGPLLLCLLRVGNTFLPASWAIKESDEIVVDVC